MQTTAATDLFQALADPTRLRMMMILRAMELAVGELAQVLGQSQPRVSRHVRILSDGGLVERRKEGSWVYLALAKGLASGPLFELTDAVSTADDRAQFAADRARLEAIRAHRAEAARRYFEAHAASWDQIRAMHIAEGEVERAIAAALGGRDIGTLVDIGTGTGRMLELFAGRARHATGIDRSSEMLRLARVKLEEAGLASVALRQGDMFALPLGDGVADHVILHQVLHYAQAPGAAIAEAARIMADDARLLVIDFAAHDREELRERDAHLRLGFADEAIRGWFEAAGLTLDHVQRLEGGELTVILWRGVKAVGAGRRAAA